MGHDEYKHPRDAGGKWTETAKDASSVALVDEPSVEVKAAELGLTVEEYADYLDLLADPGYRVKYLENPFNRGDKIVVPAGTPFRSMNPSIKGPQVTKRATTIRVHMVSNSYRPVAGYNGAPAKVTIAGGGGYWKDFEVTEEMLEANGKPVAMIRRDRYYDRDEHPIEDEFYDADGRADRTWDDGY